MALESLSILYGHIAVGIVWIALAIVLLVVTVRISKFLKDWNIRRTVFRGILFVGYAFTTTGVLHFVEEVMELQGNQFGALLAGLVNHIFIVAILSVVLYSFYGYWVTLNKVST